MMVSFATRLFAVRPIPSPLLKLSMQRFLSLPVNEHPGGSVIECGQTTDVVSSIVRGPVLDSADISSVREATEMLEAWLMGITSSRVAYAGLHEASAGIHVRQHLSSG